jgi:chaperonin GroES
MKFKPLHDRVVIRPLKKETKTESGVILPDAADDKPSIGEVLAVGSGKDTPMTVKVGDTVMYGAYAGGHIEIEKEKLLIMKESEIMGVF